MNDSTVIMCNCVIVAEKTSVNKKYNNKEKNYEKDMICSQCHASAALQSSLIGLPLAEALSADRRCQNVAL